MSADIFDLGKRLHAAITGEPSIRTRYAPVLPPAGPIAVTLTGDGRSAVLQAASSTGTATGHGQDALAALTALGTGLTTVHRTLVVPDRDTLTRLAALARQSARRGQHSEPAAVIGWWEQRADHPGTGAVLILAEACQLRWRLGTVPEHERPISAWQEALGVTDPGPAGLLGLAAQVSAGHTLPGLLEFHGNDSRSWEYHRERTNGGDPWWRADSRTEAALGLATRSDAAELYESLRLGDPLVALRESFTGTVVTGTVTAVQHGQIELRSRRLICRLRPDTLVQGWAGGPQDAPQTTDDPRTRMASGRLDAVTISTTGHQHLLIRVTDTIVRPGTLTAGDLLTLRPRAVDPRQQSNGRRRTRARYQARGNWLSGNGTPPRQRRDVPLDVAISAADD